MMRLHWDQLSWQSIFDRTALLREGLTLDGLANFFRIYVRPLTLNLSQHTRPCSESLLVLPHLVCASLADYGTLSEWIW